MRRIISMPAAIIAALVMLAVFDSAARSDEQAQLLKSARNCLAVSTKTYAELPRRGMRIATTPLETWRSFH